jgi:hypothetical protein
MTVKPQKKKKKMMVDNVCAGVCGMQNSPHVYVVAFLQIYFGFEIVKGLIFFATLCAVQKIFQVISFSRVRVFTRTLGKVSFSAFASNFNSAL